MVPLPEIATAGWILLYFISIIFTKDRTKFFITTTITIVYLVVLGIILHLKLKERYYNISNSPLNKTSHIVRTIITIFLTSVMIVVIYVSTLFSTSFVKPFANTFGYLFVSSRVKNKLDNIVKIPSSFSSFKKKIIENYKSIMLNSITTNKDDVKNIINEYKIYINQQESSSSSSSSNNDNNVDGDDDGDDDVTELIEAVKLKYDLGGIIWLIIAGALSSLTINYTVNTFRFDGLINN